MSQSKLTLLERRIETLVLLLADAQTTHRHFEGGDIVERDQVRRPAPLADLWRNRFRWRLPWQLKPVSIEGEVLVFRHFVICQRYEGLDLNVVLAKWCILAIPTGYRLLRCIACETTRAFYSDRRLSSCAIPSANDFVCWKLETISLGTMKTMTILCWLPNIACKWIVRPNPFGIRERVIPA